jgi:hypothetical protein
MYSGTLINDLFAVVERVGNSAPQPHIEPAGAQMSSARPSITHSPGAEPTANDRGCSREISESEQFSQSLGLSPAHGYLGLLLVVHAQLVRTLEPGNNFANAVDIHQVGTVGAPEKICV